MHARARIPKKKIEMVRGENSQSQVNMTTAVSSFVEDKGGVPMRCKLWRLNSGARDWGTIQRASQEGLAAFSKASETVPGLLGVGTTCVLQLLPEDIFIFLQHQKLAKDHTGLVSKPFSSSFLPRTSSILARISTGFSPWALPQSLSVLGRLLS